MCHILGFCNDCFDHYHVFIWNDERIIGQRERIIGQRSRNNRENDVEIWNRIIGNFLGIIGSCLLYSHAVSSRTLICSILNLQ